MNGFIISLLVVGAKKVTYQDGDVTDLHQTLIYFGDADPYPKNLFYDVAGACANVSARWAPITAKVIGKGKLGKDGDDIAITESHYVMKLRQELMGMGTIHELMKTFTDHPAYIPHVSGLDADFGDYVTFDRISVRHGDNVANFSFTDLGMMTEMRKRVDPEIELEGGSDG